MSIVHVVAVLTAKPGRRSEVLAQFHGIVPTVLSEDGCIAYEATIDTKNGSATQVEFGADTFVVIEKWASLTALRAHSESRHMAAFADRTKDMMATRTVHILSLS
jgi:quinol monooxygenase YgiN